MRIRWQSQTVETAGQSTWPSLAFSPSGQPAIAYYSSLNSALRFAMMNPDGSWAISTVDTAPSDCKPSLAFRFGRPAISYRVGANEYWGALRFALFTGGSPPWSISSVAEHANASSLAFDSSQRGAISYYDPISSTLKFARQGAPDHSSWVTETVDSERNAGDFNALAFTPLSGEQNGIPGDRPAIAYLDGAHNLIKFARLSGTSWSIQTVRGGIGWCSLDFAVTGSAGVGCSSQGYVNYNHQSSGSGWWGASIQGGITCSLAYNSASPRPTERGIAFTNGHMILAYGYDTWAPGYYRVEEAGKDQLGNFVGPFELPSLAFSPTGQPGISYYDSANSTIKYAAGTIVRLPFDTVFDILESLLLRLRLARSRSSPGADSQVRKPGA
jgi:hypothetical protein